MLGWGSGWGGGAGLKLAVAGCGCARGSKEGRRLDGRAELLMLVFLRMYIVDVKFLFFALLRELKNNFKSTI